MRTNFAPQARASRKSRSKRSSACSTVGRPASKFDRMTRSRVLGKFSTDCEALQKRQVNACAGIGFPQVSQSLDLCIPEKFRQTAISSKMKKCGVFFYFLRRTSHGFKVSHMSST
jgi:hypothetical protein